MDDKRIYLLKNISELEKKNVENEISKYKILTDASVFRFFTWGPYTLSCDINEQADYKHTLYLKVLQTPRVISKEDINSGDACYGDPNDAASEIVTLASLFLRSKFWLSDYLSINDVPIHKIRKDFNDKDLINQKKNLAKLTEMFELIKNLNLDCQKRFLTAAKFYHRALLTIEDEPDMAYLHLVTSIEVLSGKQRSKIKIDPRLQRRVIFNIGVAGG